MPKFRQAFLQSIFYLFRKRANGEFEGPLGTGVIICMGGNLFDSVRHFYAVTAQHVIKSGASHIRFNTQSVKENGSRGLTTRFVEREPFDWEFEDGGPDIAVIDITEIWTKADPALTAIPLADLATDNEIGRLKISPGEDAFMVGLFVPNPGSEFNAPAVRFGNVAQLASSHHPVEQGNKAISPSHAIDMHSRPGFSGSPVFVYRTPDSDLNAITQNGDFVVDYNKSNSAFVKLMGIHSGQFPEVAQFSRAEVNTERSGAPIKEGDKLIIQSSMTIVVPAQAIADILHSPKFQSKRAERGGSAVFSEQPIAGE